MPVLATKPQPKAAALPPTNESPKARRVREIVCAAIQVGRELTAAEASEINKAFANDQVAAVQAVVERFAGEVAVGATIETFRPMLTRLLDGGAAGAIFDVAKHRHQLQTEFEKTPWHARKLQLLKNRDERQVEFEAADRDEDSTPMKTKRLLHAYEDALKELGNHLNGNVPELVAFRKAMEPTSEPTFNTLDWRMFAL